MLDVSNSTLSYEPGEFSQKSYFEYIHLHAMKINFSLKIAQKEIQMDPRSIFAAFLLNFGVSFGNLSDSPLQFKELLITYSFQTLSNLTWLVIKNYTNQGIMQFYKILGASDIIGNPVGLVDKIGRGVIEFFNAPAKGLLKGPKEFAGGVGKGVKSLITGVVGGSMESLSKATGSLYGVVKSLGGDPEGQGKLAKPNNAFSGLYQGIKGGVSELAGGFAGIFTKPYKGAKQGGTKGFFKGIGKGLLGVITSPFTAVLRTGNNISAGISATATRIGKGKMYKQGRFRLPRYFGPRMILEEYDPDLCESYECLYTLNQGQHHKQQQFFIQNDYVL